MACSLRIAWNDGLTSYNFGPQHPLAPVRVELTMELCRRLGVFDAPGVSFAPVEPADDALLELVHSRDYIAAVTQAGKTLEPGPRASPGAAGSSRADEHRMTRAYRKAGLQGLPDGDR